MKKFLIISAVMFLLGGCTTSQQKDRLLWERAENFTPPPCAEAQNYSEALRAFATSCRAPKPTESALNEVIDTEGWRETCRAIPSQGLHRPEVAKQFFNQQFTPYLLSRPSGDTGLVTGYYIPVLNGSLKQSARYHVPVYGVPKTSSFPSRAEIEAGAHKGQGLELLYVDDPVMLFFTHIQGSGRVQLDNGQMVSLQYAGQNKYAYTAIGRILVDRGEISSEDVSLQSIRQWLYDHPAEAKNVMNQNESYVYFAKENTIEMPKGAQGIPLTPMHSIAIDPNQVPYGLPILLETQTDGGQFCNLVITQDTGGAIKGPLRGDIFFGQGSEAEAKAGYQKHQGKWTALVPKGI